MKAVEWVSHRANACGAPENTIDGVFAAWEVGSDAVEVDLRVTTDSVVYLFHDREVRHKSILNLTYAEVLGLVGSTVLTTLQELLALESGNGYYILDLKDIGVSSVLPIIEAVRKSAFPHAKLTFQSDDVLTLDALREWFPASRYLYRNRLSRRFPFFSPPKPERILKTLASYDIDGVSFKGRRFIDREFVGAFKDQGLLFYVWTINDPSRAKFYKEVGVDGIITDDIVKLRQFVTPSLSDGRICKGIAGAT